MYITDSENNAFPDVNLCYLLFTLQLKILRLLNENGAYSDIL